MKQGQLPRSQVLRPIVDMYRNSAVALTGCHSQGLQRDSCELDVIVVTGERRPPRSTRVNGVYVDLFFVDEKEVLKPSNPEHAVSMARAVAVRDSSLVLSTGMASSTAMLSNSARRSSRARLASSLKGLGRVEDALAKGLLPDADFWLVSASYDFAYALLYSKEVAPAPSHLVGQLRGQSRGAGKSFEAFSRGAGLERASRASCESRLEGVEVLHDLLWKALEAGGASQSAWSRERLEIIRAKAQDLAASIEHPESYSFLGQEALKALMAVAWRETSQGRRKTRGGLIMNALAPEKGGLLSERLLGELGVSRSRSKVEGALESLRDQVSRLAKWV